MEKEILIHLRPENDFEKLLFAQRAIKELIREVKYLKIELGIVTSERDELQDKLNSICNDKI